MTRINIDLDDRLVKQGMKRLSCRSKKELVNLALCELVRKESIKDLLTLRRNIRRISPAIGSRHNVTISLP
jgi:Arc/MetJ family transcription regulator